MNERMAAVSPVLPRYKYGIVKVDTDCEIQAYKSAASSKCSD
jgi:hypothetical protein